MLFSGLAMASSCISLPTQISPSLASCGGLNENGLYRLMYLKTLSELGGTVWERLGGVALLEAVYHWGGGADLEVSKAHPLHSQVALLGNYGVQFIFTRLVATRFGET